MHPLRSAFLSFSIASALAFSAHADEPSAATAPASTPSLTQSSTGSGFGRFGIRISPLVGGSVTASLGSQSASADLSAAFAVSPYLEYQATRYFAIGFGPQFGLGISPANQPAAGPGSGTEISFNLRLKLGFPVHERVYPYALVTPGVAVLVPPSDSGGKSNTGFQIGAGAGVALQLSKSVSAFFELVYQASFYSDHGIDARISYLSPQLGLQFAF